MYCLPLYDPLRLVEEICMLDHLSRGRFDFGVGRGIVPYEMAYFNLHHLETEEIYREALEVILQGLTSEVLDHRGPRYTYRKVPDGPPALPAAAPAALVRPRPPRGRGVGGRQQRPRHHQQPGRGVEAALRPLPRGLAAQARRDADAEARPVRHVVVAPTDAQAEAIARPNYAVWYANLTKLWRDFGAIPVRFARDFDEARQRGVAIAGTPARVREEIERQVAASGCTYFVVPAHVRQHGEPEASASIDLFAAEVMPHVARLTCA